MLLELFPEPNEPIAHVSALEVIEITPRRFRDGNRRWHRTLPQIGAINTMRVCYGAFVRDGGRLVAVAAWSNPVARELDQRKILELRRFAIGPDAPKDSASWMMARMIKGIRKKFQDVAKAISYSDEDEHLGTIYKASNWIAVVLPRSGGAWNNRGDGKRKAVRLKNKIRWEFKVRKLKS